MEMCVSRLSSPEKCEAAAAGGGPKLRQFVLRNKLLFHYLFRLRKNREMSASCCEEMQEGWDESQVEGGGGAESAESREELRASPDG
jgi:hypothetical protein